MLRNLIISYDFNKEVDGRKYSQIRKELSEAGRLVKLQKSQYYLSSALDVKSLAKRLRLLLDGNDTLTIFDTTCNAGMIINMEEKRHDVTKLWARNLN